jgi:hypothetical protein
MKPILRYRSQLLFITTFDTGPVLRLRPIHKTGRRPRSQPKERNPGLGRPHKPKQEFYDHRQPFQRAPIRLGKELG